MSRSNKRKNSILLLHPQSPVNEVYRTLRTNIQFACVDTAAQVFLVASAQRGDGRTMTVAQLSIAYAQEGKKVLMIDSDMRQPMLHTLFQVPNRTGLSNILAGQNLWQDIIKDTPINNLSLLTAGQTPPNPSELLGSKRIDTLIEELRKLYDIIIFDAPPVLPVPDSLQVSACCDGVILVVAAGKGEKSLVRKSKASLEHASARVIGVVLNDVSRKEASSGLQYN